MWVNVSHLVQVPSCKWQYFWATHRRSVRSVDHFLQVQGEPVEGHGRRVHGASHGQTVTHSIRHSLLTHHLHYTLFSLCFHVPIDNCQWVKGCTLITGTVVLIL